MNAKLKYFLLGLLLFLGNANAPALFLDPLRIEITGPPGATYTGRITLRNDQPEPLTVEVSFHDDSAVAADWIQVETGPRTLEPHRSEIIPYTVKIPSRAHGELRGRFAVSERPASLSENTVSLMTRIAIPIYVTVRGTEQYAGRITEMQVGAIRPLTVLISLENQGNVHVRPTGELSIIDSAQDREVARVHINPLGYPVLPGLTDQLVARSDLSLPAGLYRLVARLHLANLELNSTTNLAAPP